MCEDGATRAAFFWYLLNPVDVQRSVDQRRGCPDRRAGGLHRRRTRVRCHGLRRPTRFGYAPGRCHGGFRSRHSL